MNFKPSFTRFFRRNTNQIYEPSYLPGQDPFVIPYKNNFLLIQSRDDARVISIRRFKDFTFSSKFEERIIVPQKSDHTREIWAPELHRFKKFSTKWYIYYAADDGNNKNHRMYVLESDTKDPMGTYHEVGKIYDKDNDYWAIDLTVFEWEGKLYAIWSGWEYQYEDTDFPQNLYIAPMSNPWTISGTRVLISKPEYEWEKSVAAINEGPQVLKRYNNVYIVYSADASWAPEYKLGLLYFIGGNPLSKENWVKFPKPVFAKEDTPVYGPGHASFIIKRNKLFKEKSFIVYHNKVSDSDGWEREIRVKPFTWTKEGIPIFGKPE